jgi:Flp pilus assembly protein TadD
MPSPQAQRSPRLVALIFVLLAATACFAGDLRIPLPKSSKPTPVQKLNQQGVAAVQKHDYAKAKKLFYRAYLIDPNDPFTLNNLGYISELEGDLDRATRFYALAAEHPSQAVVAKASEQRAVGKPVDQIAGSAGDQQMEINRLNVSSIGLLGRDRVSEADQVLQKALALDPKNPFTLNNLGYTKEKEGELELALSFYLRSAAIDSSEPIIVAVNKSWRGKGISSVAAENAKKARRALEREHDVEARVARLNLRGVSAVNRNERRLGQQYFQQAFALDPDNAFTLNNMGYVAELDGDRETADYFYAKALGARKSNVRVAVATRKEAEGERLKAVADINDQAVDAAQQTQQELRRRQGGSPALLRRDNVPVSDTAPPEQQEAPPVAPQPSASPR